MMLKMGLLYHLKYLPSNLYNFVIEWLDYDLFIDLPFGLAREPFDHVTVHYNLNANLPLRKKTFRKGYIIKEIKLINFQEHN